MEKSVDAFRTISEVADELALPQHVLRFWETRFPQVKPLKRAGGRRYYRPADIVLLRTIRQLLYEEGFTIKGVQKLIKEQGTRAVREGSLPMPVDLAQLETEAGDDLPDEELPDDEVAVEERPARAPVPLGPIQRDASAADAVPLPDSIRAALSGAIEPARLSRRDIGSLRDALATVDECARILEALRRPRGS